jgi:hypothetical protein
MVSEVLHVGPDLVPSHVYLFRLLKESMGRQKFEHYVQVQQ